MPAGLGDEKLWLCPTLDNVTPFNDLSDQANNGTANGGIATVADTSAGGAFAYDLDGTDDYIRVPKANFGFLIETNSFSQSAWVRSDSATGQRTFIGGNADNAGKGTLLFQDTSGVIRGSRAKGSGAYSPDTTSSTAVPASQWTHFAWVVDNTTSTLYMDGVQIFQETGTFVTVAGPLTDDVLVGCYGSGIYLFSFLDGLIDDVRIFDRPLNQAEIAHLAEARGITGSPPQGLGDEKLWLCPSINNSPNDISGNGNNGVYQGGLGTITDVSNGGSLAYDFDGTNDWIECSGPTGNSGAFSLSMWASRHIANANATTIVGQYDTSASDRYWIVQQKINAGGSRFSTYPVPSTSSGRVDCEGTVASGNTWFHLVAMYDAAAGEQRLYIDGVLVDSDTSTGFQATTIGLSLGSLDGSQFWDGRLDDVRQYNRALTQAEITHLASQRGVLGTPFIGLGDEQLWLCPSLQDGTNDLSGNNNDGVYNGGMGTVTSDGKLAYDFDGVDDYIDCGQVLDVNYDDSASYSFWINPSDGATSFDAIMGKMLSSGTYSGHLVAYRGSSATPASKQNGITFILRSDNTAGRLIEASAPSSVTAGQWQQVVVTYDGSSSASGVSVYVDGVSISTSVIVDNQGVTTTVTSAPYGIGARNADSVFFNGSLDDLRQYDRVLTQAEITHLATSRGIEGSPSTPTAQYNAFATHAFKQLFQQRLR